MGIRNFIESHYSHFNAGELANCIDSLREFLEGGGRLMITLAGAMSTAEIGKSLAPAIRSQKVHAFAAPEQIWKRSCLASSLDLNTSMFQTGGIRARKRMLSFTKEE